MPDTAPLLLFGYPQQAFLGRVIPKNKIYEQADVNSRLKDLFVRQIDQIVWGYKLAPETINLPPKPGISEIQIFRIQLKNEHLDEDVLRCIDGVVKYPILFELTKGHGQDSRTRLTGAYKRPSDADASRWVVSDYFSTDWVPTVVERKAMPHALDLGSLYKAMLEDLLPLQWRQGESLKEWVERVELAIKKRNEIEKVQARLAKEKQFNRKVEINATLRKLKAELDQLSFIG